MLSVKVGENRARVVAGVRVVDANADKTKCISCIHPQDCSVLKDGPKLIVWDFVRRIKTPKWSRLKKLKK